MTTISRLDFLKGLAASAIALGLKPYDGIAVDGDHYQNRRLGLSFDKPGGWQFDSIADFAALRERQILLDNSELSPLKNPENLPVVIISNPKCRQGDFAPAVSLWDEPLPHPRPANEIAAHLRMINALGLLYANTEIIEAPKTLRVTGANGTHAIWRYEHELDNGQTWLLKVRSLLFFRGLRVHTFHIVDDCNNVCLPQHTIERFLQSINYQTI